MSGFFEIKADGTTINITSYMTYDYEHIINQKTIENRTRGGALFSYKIGNTFESFNIPLMGISSSHMTIINSWWKSQQNVLYTENSSVTLVDDSPLYKIINTDQPVRSYLNANFNDGLFNGMLKLELK